MSLHQNSFVNRYDRIGFNVKKRPKKLMRLVPLGIGSNLEAINRIEQDLIKDIRDIDEMLNKRQSNMTYIHGFLFNSGMTKQLIKQFYSAIQVNPDALEDGFYLWRLKESDQNYQLVSSKLINSPRHFPQKLLDKSIENLQNYDIAKHQQSVNKGKDRWNTSLNAPKISTFAKAKRIKTEFSPTNQQDYSLRKHSIAALDFQSKNFQVKRKMTDFKQITEHYRSNSHPLQLQSYVETRRSKQLESQAEQQYNTPSLEQLTVMIKKQQNIVGIWLPPSSCPQLMGVMSIQIKEKAYNVRYCLIKKYYWYRHGLSRRFFDSILQWSNNQFDSIVQLAIITTRDTFNSHFSSLGWHLISWINEDKIKIAYSKI